MAPLSWQEPSAEPVQEMTQTSTHARRDGNGTLGPPQAALAPHCRQNLRFSTPPPLPPVSRPSLEVFAGGQGLCA